MRGFHRQKEGGENLLELPAARLEKKMLLT
jgi:hypothetical protein